LARQEDTRRSRLKLDLQGMSCASCAARVEQKLNSIDGVEATVNYATEQATIHRSDGTPVEQIIAAVKSVG
jgi:Cu+-exporting ATPase